LLFDLRQGSLQGLGFFGVEGLDRCVHEKLLKNQRLAENLGPVQGEWMKAQPGCMTSTLSSYIAL
jgi:hypothetical protein